MFVPLWTVYAAGMAVAAGLAAFAVLVVKYLRLRQRSECDHLTTLYNRQMIEAILDREIYRHDRGDQHLCVAMLDIDHFKQINDTYGHRRGDLILIELARVFRGSLRRYDAIGRWGGEEFVLILPQTALTQALAACERIRLQVERHGFGPVRRVTVSVGIVEALAGEPTAGLIARADAAMYRAKENGRNRSVAAEAEMASSLPT